MRYKISNYELLKELLRTMPEGDSCVEWPRGKGRHGYGLAVADGFGTALVHRIAYQIVYGRIADNVAVLHRCQNRPCFRPAHLLAELHDKLALLNELLKFVPPDNLCMEWPCGKLSFGYGGIAIDGRTRAVHRIAYELAVGPIPDGLDICHHCDNPPCFRPSHLFPGTHADNMHDMYAKKRRVSAKGEKVNTAKLTANEVCEIRHLRTQGRTQQFLADQFGVLQTTISRILLRQHWKHLST